MNRYRVEKYSSVVGSFTSGETTVRYGWWVWDEKVDREVTRARSFREAVFAAHRIAAEAKTSH